MACWHEKKASRGKNQALEAKRLQNNNQEKTTLVVDLPKPQKAAYAQAARWEGKKLAVWVLEHLDHAADDALAEEKASKMMKEMK